MSAPRRADIRLNLAPDGSGLHIAFDRADHKLVGFTLEAPELDRLIALLGAARAELAERVPAELEPGARVPATFAPAWQVSETGTPGTHAVMLRHPGFGWLGFVLLGHEARALAESLDTRCSLGANGRLNTAARR